MWPRSDGTAPSGGLLRPWRAAKRRWLLLAALVAAAFLLLGPRPAAREAGTLVAVKRADLVLSVEVEGELAAVRSAEIGAPPIAETEFKIAFLAPEGTAVRKGDSVLRFDTEALDRQLAQKRAERDEAAKKVEQKQIDLRMKLLELEQQEAEARAELAKAVLKTEVPAALLARVELDKARLDRRGRERDLENVLAETRSAEAIAGAELRSLGQQLARAEGRVRALEAAIDAMDVRAPQDGIVVYRTNWREEKKKVGDSAWFGEVILGLPDLATMRGDGFVDEADGAPVAPGQPVTIRLEARPDADVPGKVARIGRTVRQRSWRTPLKGFRVEIALAQTDRALMRPAMRFRGEIETARLRGLLLVPREAVFLRDLGPVAWVKGRFGWRERRVSLGRRSRTQVEVVAGLREGELVSTVDWALPAEDRGGPAGARP